MATLKILNTATGDYLTVVRGPRGVPGPAGPAGATGPAGVQGATGGVGPQGPAGPQGIQGVQGPTGAQGAMGASVKILGEKATPAALPSTGNSAGDAWIVTSDGDLYVWSTDLDPDQWVDVGQVVGPQGPMGPQGVQGIQGPTGPQGATGETGPSGEAAGKILYYAPSDASDIATYKTLLTSPSAGVEQTIVTTTTGTNTDFPIASFVTDPGVIGAVDFPAGTAFRLMYAMVNSGTARLHLMVYKRSEAGVETLVRDEYSPDISAQTPTSYRWASTQAATGALLATDRIVNKLYAQRITGGGGTVTVTTYYEGSARTSQIQTTISAGAQGPEGPQGPPGAGVPTGGTTGQVLAKNSGTDLDVEWIDPPEGGGSVEGLAFAANLTGLNPTISHNLGTLDVSVTVYRLSDGVEVLVPNSRVSNNAVMLDSAVDLAGHRVVIFAYGGLGAGGGSMSVQDTVVGLDVSSPQDGGSVSETVAGVFVTTTETATVALT